MFKLFRNKRVLKKQELIINQFLIHGPEYPNIKTDITLFESPIIFNIPEFNIELINKKQLSDLESQSLSCYAVFNETIKFFNSFCQLKKWAITNKINVEIRAGLELNAYYFRDSFKFFYGPHKNKNKMVYSVDFPEIISHELGHGLLDSMRPDLWNVQSMEIWAFHESFADIVTMMYLLQYDSIIQEMLQETKGDLEKSNLVSRLGEGFENSISDNNALRDASIQVFYEKPENLYLKNQKYNRHEFSKIFTSSWYRIFLEIFKILSKSNKDVDAIKIAKDIAFKYLVFATKRAPNNIRFFESIANLMLIEDQNNGNKYQDIIRNVFSYQKIISEKIMFLSLSSDVKKGLSKKEGKFDFFYASTEDYEVKISEKLILAQNNNPLINYKIELASENIQIMNNDKVITSVFSSSEEILNAALCCLNYHNQNNKDWKIKKDKLIRNKISCF